MKLYELDRSVFPPLISDKLTERGIYSKLAMIVKTGSAPPAGNYVSSVTKNNITWTFDTNYLVGQFATGDYYVVAPDGLNIIDIDPLPTNSPRIMNGSMINPTFTGSNRNRQGYDAGLATTYESTLENTVGIGVSTETPLHVAAGSSLISSESIATVQAVPNPQLQSVEILTVLASTPASGSFRPPYCGSDKTINFNVSDIDYEILPSLSLSGISLPSPTTLYESRLGNITSRMRHATVDHFRSIGAFTQGASAIDNYPNYGREFSSLVGTLSLLLMLDSAAMEAALSVTRAEIAISLIQMGIDLYGTVVAGNYWHSVGGLNSGRKWPIMFAGLLLDNTAMKNIGSYAFTPFNDGIDSYYNGIFGDSQWTTTKPFQEDGQCFYVGTKDYNSTHLPYWGDTGHSPFVGPFHNQALCEPYLVSDYGLPEWGENEMGLPAVSDKYFSLETYRLTTNTNGWVGIALCLHILDSTCGTKALWNNNAFIDLMDRSLALTTRRAWQRSWSAFQEDMWDVYRGTYGDGFIGQVYVNGTTVITNTISPVAGTSYAGVAGTEDSHTDNNYCNYIIRESVFSDITGYIGNSNEVVNANCRRLYGNCATYGIVK
jgi:hypothetical protein